jgi:hypothetical protein
MGYVAETATLVHDYTMADVNRIARVAVSKHYRTAFMDRSDREDAAWHAIVIELYSRAFPPSFFELLCCAMEALDREFTAARHHNGWQSSPETKGKADRPELNRAPRFTQYWLPRGEPSDGFSDRICDVMALADSLAVLTGDQYEAITTLAAFDNAAGPAADALGLKYHCFMYRVYSGREKIKAAWFGDETPVTAKPTGETCRVGHSRTEHGVRRPDGIWECRACKRAAARRHSARSR